MFQNVFLETVSHMIFYRAMSDKVYGGNLFERLLWYFTQIENASTEFHKNVLQDIPGCTEHAYTKNFSEYVCSTITHAMSSKRVKLSVFREFEGWTNAEWPYTCSILRIGASEEDYVYRVFHRFYFPHIYLYISVSLWHIVNVHKIGLKNILIFEMIELRLNDIAQILKISYGVFRNYK